MPTAKVLTRFQRWLLGTSGAPERKARPDESAKADIRSFDDESERDQLETRLCRILQDQATVTAGRIFFLDLAALRNEFVEQWANLGEIVDSVARTVFRRNLSTQDAYCKHGDDGFLVVFGSLSVASAEIICQRIADDLRSMLLGRAGGGPVTVKTVVGQTDSRLLMQELSLYDKAIHVGGSKAHAASAARSGEQRRNAHRPPSQTAGSGPALTADNFDPGWDEFLWETRDSTDSTTVASLEGLLTRRPFLRLVDGDPGWIRLESARRTSVSDAAPPARIADDIDEPLSFLYQPVWDTRANLLSTYLCLTPEEVSSEPTCVAAGATFDQIDGDAVAEFDLRRLLCAADMLDEKIGNQFQLFVNTAVHAETMGVPRHRRQYLHVLRRIPETLRKFLIIQLYGFPMGVTTGRVAECVTALRPYCGAVLVETGLNVAELGKYAGIGVHSVGADLRTVPPLTNRLISDLTRFAVEAERQKLWTFLSGVTSSSQAAMAITAGVRYLSGQRVGPASDAPGHIRRFALKDFYRDKSGDDLGLGRSQGSATGR